MVTQCPVCLIPKEQLYRLSKDCSHRFCEQCCVQFISARADSFSSAQCLQEGCHGKLNKDLAIYDKVSSQVKRKLKKHQTFLFVQNNPEYKTCQGQNCDGYFKKRIANSKSKKATVANQKANQNAESQSIQAEPAIQCQQCKLLHCSRCFNKQHEGPCPVQDQSAMNGLNLKKCPRCKMWIEKSAGCDYIDCNCGAKFCYRCGNYFNKDPCRLSQIWKKSAQIKSKLAQIKIQKPIGIQDTLLFVPLLILKIILTLIFTPLFSIAAILIAVILMSFMGLLGPLVFCFLASEQGNKDKRICYVLLITLFYPVLVVFMSVLAVLIVFTYPCFKNSYHHGVYDPLDNYIVNATLYYVTAVAAIWKI